MKHCFNARSWRVSTFFADMRWKSCHRKLAAKPRVDGELGSETQLKSQQLSRGARPFSLRAGMICGVGNAQQKAHRTNWLR